MSLCGVKAIAAGLCAPYSPACCLPAVHLTKPYPAPPAQSHGAFDLQCVTASFISLFSLQAADLDGEIDLSTCYDVTEYPVQRNYGFQIHVRVVWGRDAQCWVLGVAVGCAGWCWWVQPTALSRSLLSSDEGRGVHPFCHDVWHPSQLDSDHHEACSPHHCA